MSVPFFTFESFEVGDTNAWPDSPDRTSLSVGRDAYADPEIQQALKSNPTSPLKLSDCQEILLDHHPGQMGNCTVYGSDPVLALIQHAHEQSGYIVDDSFPAEVWWNSNTGVADHRRLKAFHYTQVGVSGL
jgi:hypothetical protein